MNLGKPFPIRKSVFKKRKKRGCIIMAKGCNTRYLNYVSEISPKTKEKRSLLRAFFVGGTICLVGQFIRYFLEFAFGLYGDILAGTTSIILIFIGSLLTGLGVYDRIGKYAGGGSIVPITGFANSVVSSAIEYQTEGQVFGIGCKIFTIAGPVILYGIVTSWGLGVVYWLGTLLGLG